MVENEKGEELKLVMKVGKERDRGVRIWFGEEMGRGMNVKVGNGEGEESECQE